MLEVNSVHDKFEQLKAQNSQQWQALLGGEYAFIDHFATLLEPDKTKRPEVRKWVMEQLDYDIPVDALPLTFLGLATTQEALNRRITRVTAVIKKLENFQVRDDKEEEKLADHKRDLSTLQLTERRLNIIIKRNIPPHE